jgi:uroporphyrinogen III methyltransferase/synthase
MNGQVFLVGAGPGDPGLLTLRAVEVLRNADVLLYDALASEAIVAFAPPECERIFVGKRAGDHAMAQTEIESLMIAKAREGRRVVRLKGGDPFVFGRGGEEAEALRAAGITFSVVPGISSAFAVPAYAGIPVTHREHAASFTVLTGHEDPAKVASSLDWAKLADPDRTLILLMATANLREICRKLVENGLAEATPAAVVADGTRPTQRTVLATLATIADEAASAGIGAPAIVVIGGVAQLRERLRWFDTSPLFGKRVAITRTGEQGASFARALLERGAEPIVAPAIAIGLPDDPRPARDAAAHAHEYDWLVFTSRNGVDAFFARLVETGRDARTLAGAKIAAIGPKTARALQARGVHVDFVPDAYVGEAVAQALVDHGSSGDRVLIYRAQEGRDVLPVMLRAHGRRVDDVAAYATRPVDDPALAAKAARADVVTFASSSAVQGFVHNVPHAAALLSERVVAVIGPVTARTARDAGIRVDVVADEFTADGLVETLIAALENRTAEPAAPYRV